MSRLSRALEAFRNLYETNLAVRWALAAVGIIAAGLLLVFGFGGQHP